MHFAKLFLTFSCLSILSEAYPEYLFQTTEYPPYVCEKNNTAHGIAVEFVKNILTTIKLKAKIEIVPWSRALTKSKMGTNDIIFPAAKTSERENFILFSKEPIFIEEIIAIGKVGSTEKLTGEISDFNGKKICSAQGYSIGQKIDDAQKRGLLLRISESNSSECLNDILNGVCDFYLTDKVMAEATLKRLDNITSEKFAISKKIYESTPTYIGFSKSGKIVDEIDKINSVISDLNKQDKKKNLILSNIQDCN